MSEPNPRAANSARRGPIRATQNFAGGLFLLILAALAIYLARGLPQGSLALDGARHAAGLARLRGWRLRSHPRSLSLLKDGDALEKSALRGPAVVLLAILAFAMTIRPFSFGPLTVPGLGMLVAGPLAILIGGYATGEVKPRPLLILSLSLTPSAWSCSAISSNLPIPLFPQSFASLFPADWSQKDILRATAIVLAMAAPVLILLDRPAGAIKGIDAGDHSGDI